MVIRAQMFGETGYIVDRSDSDLDLKLVIWMIEVVIIEPNHIVDWNKSYSNLKPDQ